MTPSIELRSIASGSTGNAYYVAFGQTRVLVDAGVPYKRLVAGLADVGGVEALDVLVVTHEHHDHVRGLEGLLNARPDLTVFASAGTLKALGLTSQPTSVLKPQVTTNLSDDVEITGFRVSHDAAEVMAIRLEGLGHTAALVTDLGVWTEATVEALAGVNTLVLESNHDPDLLRRGPYPVFLKRRIEGNRGHLSNAQAVALLERVAHPDLRRVVLAHLSETNNTPELARRTAEAFLAGSDVHLHVAAPDQVSPVWKATGGLVRRQKVEQLRLF
jgi:phosphoribosyl 1,2-cyclic phosphodiesterase